jgi:hypothetical protein
MRRILAAASAVVLAISAVAIAPAVAATPYPYIRVYEDQSGSGDVWRINTYIPYVYGYPNLFNNSTGLTPTCNKAFGVQTTNWTDCITSIRLNLAGQPSGAHICVGFYDDANYGHLEWAVYDGNSYADGYLKNLNADQTDRISSIKWATYNSITQFCPLPGF